MRQKFLSLPLVLALTLTAVAQRGADESRPSADRLRSHVTYLASDKLEGRRTGSAGANLAAQYVAKEFARLGLRRSIGYDRPGMSRLEADSLSRYQQEFPFVAGVDLGKNNSVLLKARAQVSAQTAAAATASLDLRVGDDWMPLGFSSNASLADLSAAFVGYGIKADEVSHNDYAGVDVAGRVAIALEGTPDGDNPHGRLARYAGVRWKAIAARNAGAKALVVIAAEDNFKDDRLSRLSYDNSSGEAGLPVLAVSRQVGVRLLDLSSVEQLGQLEKFLQELSKAAASPGPMTSQYDVKVRVKPELDFTLSITTDVVRRNAAAYNVVGILEGTDPALKGEAIVIGAHYDHLGLGGEGSLATREGEVHHGADDNASGVAGVLELARIFSAERKSLKRTLVFIAFGGEEEGLLGSNYYVNHPVWPLEKTAAMLNMDMIGRMKERRLMIGGVGTSLEWRKLIASANSLPAGDAVAYGTGAGERPAKVPVVTSANGQVVATINPATDKIEVSFDPPTRFTLTLNEDGFGPSDHSSFYSKQIPVLFFFTGTHEDYHKPSDTAEKINYADEARVVSFVADIVRMVDSSPTRPTYAVAKSPAGGRSTGFRVYLGTIPSYAESSNGMVLDGVREGSPAEKAGLRAGDRITRLAGREVRNVYDYTYALGEMKAGQEYEVEAVRGTEVLKLKITPEARK